jgi:chromosome segregation ATPase
MSENYVIDIIANLARRVLEIERELLEYKTLGLRDHLREGNNVLNNRVHSLEQQLRETQGNVEKLAEELANTKHRVSKHATMFGYVEDEFVRLTDDILTLDERSQVLNAINKFYEDGSR